MLCTNAFHNRLILQGCVGPRHCEFAAWQSEGRVLEDLLRCGGRAWSQRQAAGARANSLGASRRACARNRYFCSSGGVRAALADHAALRPHETVDGHVKY